jgi:hypothetical protein
MFASGLVAAGFMPAFKHGHKPRAYVHSLTSSPHLKLVTYFVAILVYLDVLTLAFHAFLFAELNQQLQTLLRFFEPVAGVSLEKEIPLFSRGVKRGVSIEVEVVPFVHDFLADESYFYSHVGAEPLPQQFANGLWIPGVDRSVKGGLIHFLTLFLYRQVGQKVEKSSLDEYGNGLEVEGRIVHCDVGSHGLQRFEDIRF